MDDDNKYIYQTLSENFQKEAYSKDNSRGFELTALKAQYIKERLNEVFGIFDWEFEENFKTESNFILCHGRLTVTFKEQIRHVYATGGSQLKKSLADAYKGAATDSLSKAASFIGIDNDVFKGNINLNTVSETVKKDNRDVYGKCVLCDGNLYLARSGKSLYCERFKDESKGKHPYVEYTGQKPI